MYPMKDIKVLRERNLVVMEYTEEDTIKIKLTERGKTFVGLIKELSVLV